MLPTEELIEIRDAVIAIAMEAGNILLRHFETAPPEEDEKTTKTTGYDLVTAADRAAEKAIIAALLDHYPAHHIVGEEGGGHGVPVESADYLWFVDPIDGTTNFAHRIPHYSVSIALTDRDRQPLLGVIYDPSRDEVFAAVRGAGATLNGQPMRVTHRTTLDQSVICSGFPYDRRTNPDNNGVEWLAFLPRVRGVRRIGSAALDLAYVAAGRFDGYWERDLKPWDALAGMLLVTEAGGQVTDYAGGDQPQWGGEGRYVASNGRIHAEMLAVLAQARASRT